MKTATVAAALLVLAAGALGCLAWLKWQEPCCDITSENYDDLVVCSHGKAWYRGSPRAAAVGPLGYMVVPSYRRVTEARALEIMRAELDVELVAIAGASEEEDKGGHHGGSGLS